MKKNIFLLAFGLICSVAMAQTVTVSYENNIKNPGGQTEPGDHAPANNDLNRTALIPCISTGIKGQVWGGGGGGGSCSGSFGAAGGGAGGYAELNFATTAQGKTATILVGKCGISGDNSNGGTGGNSSLVLDGYTLAGNGGEGGDEGYSFHYGTNNTTNGPGRGGSASVTSNAGIATPGQTGANGGYSSASTYGGKGGDSPNGGAGGARRTATGRGYNGYNPGGGGGGGTAAETNGGCGAGGRVVISFTFNPQNPTISGNNSVCEGEELVLTTNVCLSDGGSYLKWYKDGVELSNILFEILIDGATLTVSDFSADDAGVYTVEHTFHYSFDGAIVSSGSPYISGTILSSSNGTALISDEFNVTMNPKPKNILSQSDTICYGDNLDFTPETDEALTYSYNNGIENITDATSISIANVTSNMQFLVTPKNSNNCTGTPFLMNVVVKKISDGQTDAVTICANELPYHYDKDGVDTVFTAAGVKEVHFYNENYCDNDSAVVVTLNVKKISDGQTDTKTICANELPYHYDKDGVDTVFTAAGIKEVHFPNENFCGNDSIVEVTLIVKKTSDGQTDEVTICADKLPYTYGESGVVFDAAGTKEIPFSNENFCNGDSIVTVTINVKENFPIAERKDTVITVCPDAMPFHYGDSIFENSGETKTIYFQSEIYCDSAETVTVVVKENYPLPYETVEIALCDDYAFPYIYGDSAFYGAETKTVFFPHEVYCDSAVVVTINVKQKFFGTDALTICGYELPYRYGETDTIFTEAGTKDVHFASENYCDSIVTVTLSVKPQFVKAESITVCARDLPYFYGDIELQEGAQTLYFASENYCDSAVTVTLNVNELEFTLIGGQKYNKVLYVNNHPQNNGGYNFIEYQWYKNDIKLAGETGQYYADGQLASHSLDASAEYKVAVKDSILGWLMTCPMSPELRVLASAVLRVYPNPVNAGNTVIVEYPAQTAQLNLYNSSGNVVGNYPADKTGKIEIPMPATAGVYVLKTDLGDEVKIIVK